jgi:glycosyltransferase involved in cell wall biosynthesis
VSAATPRSSSPLLTIALPVFNGGATLGDVVGSVLAQTCSDFELVISDNASSDDTEDVARRFAREDARVRYHRHATNVGLLRNFTAAAGLAHGTWVRWIGDDDHLEPDFVAEVLTAVAADPKRVLVTTEIVYRDETGVETLGGGYDATPMGSADPVERFAGMLRLLTTEAVRVDPLYATIRRDVATVPRRNMLREDQVFAARLALAGPWGHVAAPLARRTRREGSARDLARLLGVPSWHRHVRVLLQCRELSRWVDRAALTPTQRRRAHAEIARFYLRSKQDAARRVTAKVELRAGRPPDLSVTGVR